jgi:pimeloyl-ACP methyl ester carboxylesterase
LDGRLRPVRGVLRATLAAQQAGFTRIIVPLRQAGEAKLVAGVDVFGRYSAWHAARTCSLAARIAQVLGRTEDAAHGWANALDEKEAKELYDTFHVAGSGISLMQMGYANLNPWTEAKVNTKNPDRGPLLIIEGEKDHTVALAIANAAYKRQRRNPGVTEFVKVPNRGHALTIDHGWQEVAQIALDFVKRFLPAKPS